MKFNYLKRLYTNYQRIKIVDFENAVEQQNGIFNDLLVGPMNLKRFIKGLIGIESDYIQMIEIFTEDKIRKQVGILAFHESQR